VQLEVETAQLKMKCRQQEVCINQLVNKLKEIDGVRRSEKEMFNAQLAVYRDDFASEQLDRHRAQERVVKLEQQLNAVMQKLLRYEPSSLRDIITSSVFRTTRCDSLSSNNSHHDGSLQMLVRRGCRTDSDYQVRPDTPPHSH
jgi:ABC-type phosphate transport system auxiliary subunit